MVYIPDGMSKDQWEAMKKKDAAKNKVGKFDGTSGMKFRSRSFEEFQKGRESGKLTYNMVRFKRNSTSPESQCSRCAQTFRIA